MSWFAWSVDVQTAKRSGVKVYPAIPLAQNCTWHKLCTCMTAEWVMFQAVICSLLRAIIVRL